MQRSRIHYRVLHTTVCSSAEEVWRRHLRPGSEDVDGPPCLKPASDDDCVWGDNNKTPPTGRASCAVFDLFYPDNRNCCGKVCLSLHQSTDVLPLSASGIDPCLTPPRAVETLGIKPMDILAPTKPESYALGEISPIRGHALPESVPDDEWPARPTLSDVTATIAGRTARTPSANSVREDLASGTV